MKHIHHVITLSFNVNGEETKAIMLSMHANTYTTAVKTVSSSAMEEIELRLCDFLNISGPAVDMS